MPRSYTLIFWGVISALVVVAVWTAVREKSVKEQKAKQDEVVARIDKPSLIKALRAFTNEDADLFARLQRHHEIRRCLDQIVDPEFRFGILDAPSGSGKTSFLQVDLLPRLIKKGHSCIYVKLKEAD